MRRGGRVPTVAAVDITVTNAADRGRYEARIGGELAGFAEYTLLGSSLIFTHTEVDPSYEGMGVGAALARFGLDDARARALDAILLCPFISGWAKRHPEYDDVVRPAKRAGDGELVAC